MITREPRDDYSPPLIDVVPDSSHGGSLDTPLTDDARARARDVEYVVDECFFTVGQVVGMRMTVEYDAVIWWRDHYRAHDQTPHYRYLRTVLQVLTWLRGGDRWVLKSPQHCEQIPALLEVFPDATFVTTHRDPVPVTASMVTMITYSQRMAVDQGGKLGFR